MAFCTSSRDCAAAFARCDAAAVLFAAGTLLPVDCPAVADPGNVIGSTLTVVASLRMTSVATARELCEESVVTSCITDLTSYGLSNRRVDPPRRRSDHPVAPVTSGATAPAAAARSLARESRRPLVAGSGSATTLPFLQRSRRP